MSISGFPSQDVDIHLQIHGHLPEIECFGLDEPPIVCRNPNYNGVQRISEGQEAGNNFKRVEITAPSPYAGKRAWKKYRSQTTN